MTGPRKKVADVVTRLAVSAVLRKQAPRYIVTGTGGYGNQQLVEDTQIQDTKEAKRGNVISVNTNSELHETDREKRAEGLFKPQKHVNT